MGCEVIKIGDSTAIICGRKDHVCDDNGPGIWLLKDGSEVEGTDENREKYMEDIVGGSVNCSVCGRPAIQDAPYLDI